MESLNKKDKIIESATKRDLWVTVVTPSYNQGEFIEETILSVKNQDYPFLEHIIVDGGSTDCTLDILRKYETLYNMKWVSEPDAGQADAINKGFGMASGDILCWLNSDDVYLSNNVVSQVVSIFKENPEIGIVTGSALFLDRTGNKLSEFPVPSDRVAHNYERCAPYIIQPATFYTRKALDSILLDTSLHYAFDWDFFIRLTQGTRVLPVDRYWAGYRLWGNNKTLTGGLRRLQEMLIVTIRYHGYFSWQFIFMGIYYVAFLVSGIFPTNYQEQFQNFLIKVSRIVNYRSGYRIPNIM